MLKFSREDLESVLSELRKVANEAATKSGTRSQILARFYTMVLTELEKAKER